MGGPFPDDVLVIILSLCGKGSLISLARVCKHIHQLTLPYLYKHIRLEGDKHRDGGGTGTGYLRPLTFLLLQKPRLAAMVHSFTIRPEYRTDNSDAYEKEEPWDLWPDHPDLHDILKRAIDANLGQRTHCNVNQPQGDKFYDGTDPDQWLEIVLAGRNEAAILALLLPHLVNLTTIDIPFSREMAGFALEDEDRDEADDGDPFERANDSHFITEMFERAGTGGFKLNKQPIFANVTDVLIPGTYENPDNPIFFGLCAGLPVIKRLYGYQQCNSDEPWELEVEASFARLRAHTSTLEFIHLRFSLINAGNLLKLLQAPKRLKSFIYEMGIFEGAVTTQFSGIQLAIDAQQDSLEQLWLDYWHDYPFDSIEDELQPMNFSMFSALRHLRIAPIFVFGNDHLQLDQYGDWAREDGAPELTEQDIQSTRTMLREAIPTQLETLGLMHCNDASTMDRLVPCLEELLQCKTSDFPHLREIAIFARNEDESGNQLEALDRIERLAALPWNETNVRLTVTALGTVEYLPDDEQAKWGWNSEVEWDSCWINNPAPLELRYDSRNMTEVVIK